MEAVAGDTPASSATFLRLGGREFMMAFHLKEQGCLFK
jgi:hypothetical protein